MAHETEIKLALPDLAAARRKLRSAGFRVARRRVFEANTMFDTPELTLREAHSMLRLREAGGVFTITYKGSPEAARHKRREEIESRVRDGRAVRAILERLGYRAVWRYEKYRTEYHVEGEAGEAMLDETPVGHYLELEGAPRWIDRTARRLGYTHKDYILASYSRLYLERAAALGIPPGDMVFAAG